MFEFRFDRAESLDPHLQDGFLRAKVRLTKPGVYPYILANGEIQNEAKLPNEVYSQEFLKSLDGLIVTDGHPYEFGGIVNSQNYKSLIKGIIKNPRIEEGFVVADEILFDPELIQAVLSGEKAEVSLGVKAHNVKEQGFYEGKKFDSKQTELIANHVAHVKKGRIGPEARTILDEIQYATLKGDISMPENTNIVTEEPSWVKKILDGFEKLFNLFNKPQTTTQEETKTDSQKEDISVYKQQIQDLKATIQTLSDKLGLKMDEAIQRESLIETVKAVLPEVNFRGLSNLELKKFFIQSQMPNLKLDSHELVDAYYEASLELAKQKAKLNPTTEIKQDTLDIEKL